MAYKRKKGNSIVKKKKTFPFKGIDYKSGLERNMAICLTSANIDFQYEPEVFQVLEGFKFPFKSYERQGNGKGSFEDRGGKKIIGVKYTPDFIGEGFIIETKGYANESFPLRWKMFKNMLVEKGYDPNKLVIYKPTTISECQQVVKLIKEHNDKQAENN